MKQHPFNGPFPSHFPSHPPSLCHSHFLTVYLFSAHYIRYWKLLPRFSCRNIVRICFPLVFKWFDGWPVRIVYLYSFDQSGAYRETPCLFRNYVRPTDKLTDMRFHGEVIIHNNWKNMMHIYDFLREFLFFFPISGA